jgi:hypothetical protein
LRSIDAVRRTNQGQVDRRNEKQVQGFFCGVKSGGDAGGNGVDESAKIRGQKKGEAVIGFFLPGFSLNIESYPQASG